MRVLVAPDKFRGTLSASEAAEAIARGWERGDPAATVTRLPLADGGEGTLDALLAALSGEDHPALVTGPLGDPVEARYGMVGKGPARTGVIEMAEASGLTLVPLERRDAKRTTTRGTGELILAAVVRGAGRLLVCVGGSATNDAGAGAAQALGFRLLDSEGVDLAPGGAALLRLDRIDVSGRSPALDGVEVVVATDVDNPLTGPRGASATFGPQKGASPEDVELLDRALHRFADVVARDLGVEVRDVPGAGAAGGLAGGLMAFLGAHLQSGARTVMDAAGFDAKLGAADLVVTGEGSFDEQSLGGKVPGAVIDAATRAGVPTIVLCGQATTTRPGVEIRSMIERFGEEASLGRPGQTLEALAAEAAARAAGSVPEALNSVPLAAPASTEATPAPKAVRRFLEAARPTGLSFDIRRFPEGTRTAADAARALDCNVGQIVKSLVFVADGRAFLALTSGANQADPDRLAAILGASSVSRADAEQVRASTGFAIGGTPPFGHPAPLTVLVDGHLMGYEELWAAAGTPDSVFPITPGDLVRASGGKVEDFAKR
jgi:glycerate 2-kinase